MSLFEFLERLENDPFDPALTALMDRYCDTVSNDEMPEKHDA